MISETPARKIPAPTPKVSAPKRAMPAMACDCHTHVFAAPHAVQLPDSVAAQIPVAPVHKHMEMLDCVGTTRAVLVQPTFYGQDMRTLLAAIRRAPERYRGIAAATAEAPDRSFDDLAEKGISGLRFVEARTPSGTVRPGAIGIAQLEALAPRMRARRWHAELWASLDDVLELWPTIELAGVPVVLDHMGGFDAARGPLDLKFLRLVELLRDGKLWIKLALCRRVAMGEDLSVLRTFHDALVDANPDQVLWGSDWPFIRMGALAPDVGHLIDLFLEWTGNGSLSETILINNPQRRYGFS